MYIYIYICCFAPTPKQIKVYSLYRQQVSTQFRETPWTSITPGRGWMLSMTPTVLKGLAFGTDNEPRHIFMLRQLGQIPPLPTRHLPDQCCSAFTSYIQDGTLTHFLPKSS